MCSAATLPGFGPALPLTSCVTSGKRLTLSGPQLPHLNNEGDDNMTSTSKDSFDD